MSLLNHPPEHAGFHRIVCPVAFSADSAEALRYAIAFAKDYQAELFILHCTEKPRMAEPARRAAIKEELENFVANHGPAGGLKDCAARLVLVEGDPAEAITDKAAELAAELIVMRSRRRPNAALLGSTAEAVSRMAPCPVFVSHPQEHNWLGKSGDINLKRVLVAYDFSGDSELALSYGLSLAREYQTALHLLHVLPERQKYKAPELAFLPMNVDANLSPASRLSGILPGELLAGFESRGVLREGLPYREILNYAEEQRMDLICIGASGSDYGMRTLFGSNADRVLRQAPCPMLIARPLRPLHRTQRRIEG
jgi:nucleotide-binding universal stress UspA family protein